MANYRSLKASIRAAISGSSTTTYANTASLPLSHSAGDMAFITGSDALLVSNGNGWYSVTIVNETPSISSILDASESSGPFSLSTEGANTVITVTATDSEGTPITYAATPDANFNNLASYIQSSNVFTITPFDEANASATSGNVTFTASDGLSIATNSQTFTLAFGPTIESFAVTTAIETFRHNNFGNYTITDQGAGDTDVYIYTSLSTARFTANDYASSDADGTLYYCEMVAGADYHILGLWKTPSPALDSVDHPYPKSQGHIGICGSAWSSSGDIISMLLDQPNGKLHFWVDGVYDSTNSGTIPSGNYRIVIGDGASNNGNHTSTLYADNASGGASNNWTYDPSALYANIP